MAPFFCHFVAQLNKQGIHGADEDVNQLRFNLI